MTNLKFMQKLLFLLALGFSLCNLQACSDEDDTIDEEAIGDEAMADPSNDYGEITENSLVATGGYRDVKPLRATILSSINTIYQGAYSSFGVEFTPHQPNFNSSETHRVNSNSGVTNGHFETDLSSGGDGLLEPGTTYYYRAYAFMGGSRYNGETRSFVTPDLQVSKGTFVDLGLSAKWASCNMGAKVPETIGTLVNQCCAYKNFNGDWDYVPDNVNDNNWLGNSNYDVATRTLGSGYRIPTEQEWQELEDECYWRSGVCNGTKGFYICNKADGTAVIFLPYVNDITVYLSAPDDIIRNLREAWERTERFKQDIKEVQDPSERANIRNNYYEDMGPLVDELEVGEVLTENTHIYCDYGLKLSPGSHISTYGTASTPIIITRSWTHPITGKEYKFSFNRDDPVYGSGVLYLRPVSNR